MVWRNYGSAGFALNVYMNGGLRCDVLFSFCLWGQSYFSRDKNIITWSVSTLVSQFCMNTCRTINLGTWEPLNFMNNLLFQKKWTTKHGTRSIRHRLMLYCLHVWLHQWLLASCFVWVFIVSFEMIQWRCHCIFFCRQRAARVQLRAPLEPGI